MRNAQAVLSQTSLPVSQRLAAKLMAAGRLFCTFAERQGISDAADKLPGMLERLSHLATFAPGHGSDPLDRLMAAWSLNRSEIVQFLSIGLPEVDAAAAEMVCALNGEGDPRLTLIQASNLAQLDSSDGGKSDPLWMQRFLCGNVFTQSGMLVMDASGTQAQRRLCFGEGVWPGLLGMSMWPKAITPQDFETFVLAENIFAGEAGIAVAAVQAGKPVLIACLDENKDRALDRALALCIGADKRFAAFALHNPDQTIINQALGHALLRGCCPVFLLSSDLPPAALRIVIPDPDFYPAPIFVVGKDLSCIEAGRRALIVPTILPVDRCMSETMWDRLVPELAGPNLASTAGHYTLEPMALLSVVRSARARAALADRVVCIADLTLAAEARGAAAGSACAERRKPVAGWKDLALPESALADLHAAIGRMNNAASAAAMLPEGRLPCGQRLLFVGPPGTGKTLAAEVLAKETGRHLLVADTARLVSKWLGETERNLAELFLAAEESHAVLFFDEADAIFGKRTEAKDARDRYANMETAYLLQKIERFRGLVILATNLPGNLDDAFRRRFDAVIDFPNPDEVCRLKLWKLHLRPATWDAEGTNAALLADWYPIPGAWIRNAALNAVYLALAQGQALHVRHVLQAVACEYRKGGKAFPGMPPGIEQPEPKEEDHASPIA